MFERKNLQLCTQMQWLVVVVLSAMTTATPPVCPSVRVKDWTFNRLPMNDVTFSQDVVLERSVRSAMKCCMLCVQTQWCLMITFHSGAQGSSGSCRLYCKVHNLTDNWVQTPGARSYALDSNITEYRIGKSCVVSTDCSHPMTACFSGQCLCSGGYFFEHAQNACVSTCTTCLRDTYVAYHGWDFYGHNKFMQANNGSPTACLPSCTADPQCVIAVYAGQYKACYFKYATAQDYPGNWNVLNNAITYQRTCA